MENKFNENCVKNLNERQLLHNYGKDTGFRDKFNNKIFVGSILYEKEIDTGFRVIEWGEKKYCVDVINDVYDLEQYLTFDNDYEYKFVTIEQDIINHWVNGNI